MLESGEAKTGLGSDLSEDSGLFENPICRWRSCMSCCCERDNSFVPPPGSLSASGKADWPILGNRRKVGGEEEETTDEVEGRMKRLVRGCWESGLGHWTMSYCHDSCAGGWEAVFRAPFSGGSWSGGCINLYVAHLHACMCLWLPTWKVLFTMGCTVAIMNQHT